MKETWVRSLGWEDSPVFLGFPCGSAGKESTCNEGDLGSIPGLGTPPGDWKGYPFQFSGLENSMDCIVSRTWLSDFHFHFVDLWSQINFNFPLPKWNLFLWKSLWQTTLLVRVWYSKIEVEVGEGKRKGKAYVWGLEGYCIKCLFVLKQVFIVFGNIKNTCLLMTSWQSELDPVCQKGREI